VSPSGSARPDAGVRLFGGLGRWIVRHPLYPIVFWVVLLVVAVPFLSRLSSVTTNSADTAPPSSPSALAQQRFDQQFPNDTTPSSTMVLLYGADPTVSLTDRPAQDLVQNVTANLSHDARLERVASISDIYTAYSAYLAGEAELATAAIGSALAETPPLPIAVNDTAGLLWGVPAAFLMHWSALEAGNASTPWTANYPAYEATEAEFTNTTARSVLSDFYNGNDSSNAGFNGTADCANRTVPSGVIACVDATVRANLELGLPYLGLPAEEAPLASLVLSNMGEANYTNDYDVLAVGSVVVAAASGFPASWIDSVWTAFPAATPGPTAVRAFANATVDASTLASEPLPVPASLRYAYVNSAGTASLVEVSFSVGDDYLTPSGVDPVFYDLGVIDTDTAATVAASDPSGSIEYAQTGSAPLDQLQQEATSSSEALVLPITVGLLIGISMLYFRSPLTPLVTFAGLGIALILGLGGTVLVGTLITHVDSSSLALEEVFVLGVGTDYSVFLVARYREELAAGRTSDDAVVASLTWAGQSVATSGSTAIIVTLALAFSGIALLAEWGMVLSIAILITMLLSLTLVPAALKLLGPRIFWPMTGERFRRRAAATNARVREGRTYFYRAARWTQARPLAVVGVILLVSVPLAAVALNVPVSYDFYGQLPSGHPATDGLAELGQQFGPGYDAPSYALVTFAGPLVQNNVSNATEFVDLETLTSMAANTSGIQAVRSPVGPYGASVLQWLGLSSAPPATRANLLGLLAAYVGTDGRTVLLTLQTNDTGLSLGAVNAVESVAGEFGDYQTSHPEVVELAYGGGAPVIRDLAAETTFATEVILVAVTIGLLCVLVAVLRSWIIALMAVGTIGLSIGWAWAVTDVLFQDLLGFPLFFYVRTILVVLVLGLGIDYNIFLLTRVREERVRGRTAGSAVYESLGRTGGIITAAAVILACAFASLTVGEFTLIRAIGFSVATAVLLDAMVVRTYLVPASLQLLGDRAWSLTGRKSPPAAAHGPSPTPPDPER
jgi:uncharacterized membrane protein YdfJ with MMPL/SSD domain